MGLSPIFVERVFDTIQAINTQGVTIFMVEQNANMALTIANRGYVFQNGDVVLEDTAPTAEKRAGAPDLSGRDHRGGVSGRTC